MRHTAEEYIPIKMSTDESATYGIPIIPNGGYVRLVMLIK